MSFDIEDETLWKSSIDGAGSLQLIADVSQLGSIAQYQITPDGRNIIFSVMDSEVLIADPSDIYAVSIDGGEPVLLTDSLDSGIDVQTIGTFTITPDSTTVVFNGWIGSTGQLFAVAVPEPSSGCILLAIFSVTLKRWD